MFSKNSETRYDQKSMTPMQHLKTSLTAVIETVELLLKVIYPDPYVAPSKIVIRDISAAITHEASFKGYNLRNQIMALNPDAEAIALCDHFNNRCGAILGYIQYLALPSMKNDLDEMTSDRVVEWIRQDEASVINLLILTNQRYNMGRSDADINVVLRRASSIGAHKIVTHLLAPHNIYPKVDVLSSGVTTKEIALHQAIKKSQEPLSTFEGKLECLKQLLNAKGIDGEKTAVRQLLFGDKQLRPLDHLLRHKDPVQKARMIAMILQCDLSLETGITEDELNELTMALHRNKNLSGSSDLGVFSALNIADNSEFIAYSAGTAGPR